MYIVIILKKVRVLGIAQDIVVWRKRQFNNSRKGGPQEQSPQILDFPGTNGIEPSPYK